MAHWAQIDENNKVIQVTVGDNNDPAGDEGYSWLIENLGGTWIKTSYNTRAGKRVNPETNELTEEPGFRKNYAAIGYTWDEVRDAFIPPKPEDFTNENEESFTFILNEETCLWEPVIVQ